jgi:hypothetical protein
VDDSAILFGAATHDIGKVKYPEELSRPGKLHEIDGAELLQGLGVTPKLARFARTHGDWKHSDSIEDLIVALADNCWKAKRVEDLENEVVSRLAWATGQEPWQCFSVLDEILQAIAADADTRLAWQGSFPAP